jgi:Cd2+/Zn2+-exporting ATPase
MDKTGTVTKGEFAVQQVQGGNEVLKLSAALETASTHPIAQSIVAAALEQEIELSKPQSVEEIAGYGIRGMVDGKTVLCGNQKLMDRFQIAVPEQTSSQTWVLVAVDGIYAGAICISDTVKPGAAAAVKQLKQMGIDAAMLTGDAAAAAETVGSDLGISRVYAKLLPEEKLTALQQLRKEFGPVMFVGDGINDAPVLSGADVGAAMGSGADAAIEAADVVFMTSRPEAMAQAIQIAKRTQTVAWQNVVFALAVKLAVMVLGLLGHASMWLAVFADSGVAMLCVLNAVRMLYRKEK